MSALLPLVAKTFLISCASRTKMRERAVQQLTKLGIQFEIFDAIESRLLKLSTEAVSPLLINERNPTGKLTADRLGSYLSRLSLYSECARRNYGNVLIFEEDVVLDEQFFEKACRALAWIPEDWEMFYFNCWDWNPEKAKPINDYINQPGKPVLSHAVLFKASLMQRLAHEMREIKETHDLQISEMKIVRYAATEKLAKQRPI